MTGSAACGASVPLGSDSFPLDGIDAIVFAVGNARQAAYHYATAFGMTLAAYRGPETGCRDEAAYVLVSGKARFVFRGPVRAGTDLGAARRGARGRRASTSPSGTVRRGRLRARDFARRSRAGAARGHGGRARQGGARRDRHLRRHQAHAGRAGRLQRRVPARVRRGRASEQRWHRHRGRCSPRSTTAWAMWNSARWTNGSASTTGSWASPT